MKELTTSRYFGINEYFRVEAAGLVHDEEDLHIDSIRYIYDCGNNDEIVFDISLDDWNTLKNNMEDVIERFNNLNSAMKKYGKEHNNNNQG